MYESGSSNVGSSLWSVLIFFLVLILIIPAIMGGGCGWGGNRFGGPAACTDHHRDTLMGQTGIVQGEKETQAMISAAVQNLTAQNEAIRQQVSDVPRDIYIKQLEQQNFHLYMQNQSEATRNLIIQQMAASNATNAAMFNQLQMQALSDKASTDAAIANIGCRMLTKPDVQACVGLPSVSCTNTGSSSCC